jgi:hypothetical protein
MIKSILVASALLLTAGCYVPNAEQVPSVNPGGLSLMASPGVPVYPAEFTTTPPVSDDKPLSLSGDVAVDGPLLCATRFVENITASQSGSGENSVVLENYASLFALTPEATLSLRNTCDMFDMGALFVILAQRDEQPVVDKPSEFFNTSF